MRDQKIFGISWIFIRWDRNVLNTRHLILNYAKPNLPHSVKTAYLNCPVRPYIPKLQTYRTYKPIHRIDSCQDNVECKVREKCDNCKGNKPFFHQHQVLPYLDIGERNNGSQDKKNNKFLIQRHMQVSRVMHP
ncbi:hypothetical protein TNCT_358901 [Trichonephila clavata]|uniref:Uncharacterized protein n=1 Tax=Trichonephila clavata TaxID=2740835 RepID=A0A8X6IZF7_TRICU|nr:hypothetical protein TNCT_358901 [Trichonephila clavata]